MNKKEKELEKEVRLKNHEQYYALVDKIREMSLDAICNVLSVEDVISALDRIKVEFIQQQVIVEIEQSMKGSDEEEEELEVEGIPIQPDIKAGVPFMNPTELMEEVKRDMVNN